MVLPLTFSGCDWEDVADILGFQVTSLEAVDFGQSARDARPGAELLLGKPESPEFTYSRHARRIASRVYTGRLGSVTVQDVDDLIDELHRGTAGQSKAKTKTPPHAGSVILCDPCGALCRTNHLLA
jgi:hypothetical protein